MIDSKLIKWLRECYREDHTRAGVRDFFAASVENRLFVRSEDRLACGFLDSDVFTPDYAGKLGANLALHIREKEFLYGCLFLTGEIGQKKYRAPLLLYPSSLKTDDDVTEVSIDHSLYRINYSLLDVLDNKEQIEDGITQAMQGDGGVLTVTVASQIADVIHSAMPEIDVEKMVQWPHLTAVTSSQLDDRLRLLPSAGWCVVKRSIASSGVLDELGKLEELESSDWSQALREVLTGDSEFLTNPNPNDDLQHQSYISPARLSENQEHILRSAREHRLTVCHGPPGTGKSFTIANIAIDHITRGDSVLIVSKKNHAVDVIYDIITELLGSANSMVRVGRKHYLSDFKRRIAKDLSSRMVTDLESDEALTMAFDDLLKQIQSTENEFLEVSEQSLERSILVANPNIKWYQKPLDYWYKRKVQQRPLLLDYSTLLELNNSEKDTLVKKLIVKRAELRINRAIAGSRNDIKALLKGLRKVKSSDQMKQFAEVDFSSVLKLFPIWVTSLSDIHRVLPFEKEMFDVVILDEASQCDIASALPAIQRAKRVVIAGDEKQLRHVSFLSKNSMSKLAHDFTLDEETQATYNYRSVSLMDLAIENTQHGRQVATLNEHFRSVKPIISFSNRHFYNSELRIMRERKWKPISNSRVQLKYCGGERSTQGVNLQEVDAVIEMLDEFIKEGLRDEHTLASIGILSPFRSQVDAITKHVQEYAQLSGYVHRLAKHGIKVGTAHSFQGEERDIMLISLALGNSDNAGARRFLEKEDVFNVSITRAKERQVVLHSMRVEDLPPSSLLAEYLNSVSQAENAELDNGKKAEVADLFAESVAESCAQHGLNVSFHQSVASIPVDVLLEKDGHYLGIDLIGYPGHTRDAVGITKQQILNRVGVRIIPIGFVEWQVRAEEIMSKVIDLLK